MNCKPGDMAIVVRSRCGNEGRVVEVIRADGSASDSDWHTPPGHEHLFFWICRSFRPLNAVSIDGSVWAGVLERPFADAHLLPISGIPDEESIEQQEPEIA